MRPRFALVPAIAFALLMVSFADHAQAAPFQNRLGVGLKAQFGFAGEVNYEFGNAESDDDMEATAGIGLFAEYQVMRYFSVGGLFGFNFYATEGMDDANIDRNTWIDIDLLLKVKYPMLQNKLDLYIAIPLGFTADVESDDSEEITEQRYGKPKTGLGFNISILPGVSYMVWRQLGLFLEMGWVMHYVVRDIEGVDDDAKGMVNQMAFNFGAFWRF